jgi:hypothetical protein
MYNKPGKLLSGGISDTGRTLPPREVTAVDRIIGLRRRAVQIGTSFFDWPIWKAYPTWHQYNQQIADERDQAKKEGREPHTAVVPPGLSPRERHAIEMYGEDISYKEATGQRSKTWRPPGKNLGPKHPVKNAIKRPDGD